MGSFGAALSESPYPRAPHRLPKRKPRRQSPVPVVLLALSLALAAISYAPKTNPAPDIKNLPDPSPKTSTPALEELTSKLPIPIEAAPAMEGSPYLYSQRSPLSSSSIYFAEDHIVFQVAVQEREESRQEDPKDLRKPKKYTSYAYPFYFDSPASRAKIYPEDRLPSRSNYFIGNDPSLWRTDVPNYQKLRYQGLWDGIDAIFYTKEGHPAFDFVLYPGADPEKIALRTEGLEDLQIQDDGSLRAKTPWGTISISAPKSYYEDTGEPIESAWQDDQGLFHIALGPYDSTRPVRVDPTLSYSTYLGGTSGDVGRAIAVDSSGAAYVTGYTSSTDFPTQNPFQAAKAGNSDVFVTKLSPSGNTLSYSTYLGGTYGDAGSAIAVDSTGAAYVAGETNSDDFPTQNPFQATNAGFSDVFVTKLSPSGNTLSYSTYLGGSAFDDVWAIAVDSTGAAYVAGYTSSTDFPTQNPFQATKAGSLDVFVTKLSPSGNTLSYSTYLGGSGDDFGYGIAVDSTGAAYVAGYTYSTNFPTQNPFQATYAGYSDVFVTKLSPSGNTLSYSTYLGGSGSDEGWAIAVDSTGAAYVTGSTLSTDFPTQNPFQATKAGNSDVFVTKLSPSGNTLSYSTYLGGSGYDSGRAIAVDSTGAAYVTGSTPSTNFPTQGPYQGSNAGSSDVFVTKLSSSGNALAYSTYLGGSSDDYGYGIAVDSSGAAYVTGYTYSSNFPTKGAYQGSNAGSSDAFVAKLSPVMIRANTTSSWAQSSGPAQRASVTTDSAGPLVAFHSPASDLIPGDTNGVADIFVKNASTGQIQRVSVGSSGNQANNRSTFAQITPDGRYVVFQSLASNLVSGDTNTKADIFLKDLKTNAIERISVSSSGTQANGESRFAQVTPDGRYVVFQSEASNLVSGDTNGVWDVFVRDRLLSTTERVSISSSGTQGNNHSVRPSISADGCKIVFHSWATNLVSGDTNGKADVFLHNHCAGHTTQRVSVSSSGTQANDESLFPKISGNGDVVVFHSLASNLVGGDTNSQRDTFVRVISSSTTERVSVSSSGAQANGPTGYATISYDGSLVVFHGTASNLVTGDTNGVQDVFLRNRATSTTTLVSLTHTGALSDGLSGSGYISSDGKLVAFQSDATNLVPADTNSQRDIFLVRI
jgi:hypothetical protein